ncbi:hypothetical protein PBI_DEWDROP_52 [Microbacterium phage Dewdrop]|nr:hypothetical protein PBI_LEAF_52 [Microbacterium phage Leaf]QGZ17421.1 hypothetical protein PBI_DEWDROP_52 [Microbacterium phage Dewdrop]
MMEETSRDIVAVLLSFALGFVTAWSFWPKKVKGHRKPPTTGPEGPAGDSGADDGLERGPGYLKPTRYVAPPKPNSDWTKKGRRT